MAIALRQPGFLAPILESVAKPRIAVRLAEAGLHPGFMPKLAYIKDCAQGRQDRQRQHAHAFLAAFEHLESHHLQALALMLPADHDRVRTTHAKIKHDRHGKSRPCTYRPAIFEGFDIVLGPSVKTFGAV